MPWQLALGVDTVRVIDEMRAEEGALSQRVEYRFASLETRSPGAWQSAGTPRTSAGIGVQDIDISATTDQMWVQVALRGQAVGSAPAEAYSMIRASSDVRPKVIAAGGFDINPMTNSTKDSYIPLAKPLQGLGMSALMFGIKVTGLDGTTLKFRPAYRVYTADIQDPGNWSDLDTLQTVSTDTNYNSGTLAPSLGTSMFWEPGLKIVGNDARARVRVLWIAWCAGHEAQYVAEQTAKCIADMGHENVRLECDNFKCDYGDWISYRALLTGNNGQPLNTSMDCKCEDLGAPEPNATDGSEFW